MFGFKARGPGGLRFHDVADRRNHLGQSGGADDPVPDGADPVEHQDGGRALDGKAFDQIEPRFGVDLDVGHQRGLGAHCGQDATRRLAGGAHRRRELDEGGGVPQWHPQVDGVEPDTARPDAARAAVGESAVEAECQRPDDRGQGDPDAGHDVAEAGRRLRNRCASR